MITETTTVITDMLGIPYNFIEKYRITLQVALNLRPQLSKLLSEIFVKLLLPHFLILMPHDLDS